MQIINETPELRDDVTISISVCGSYLDRLEVKVKTKQGDHTTNDYYCLEIPCNPEQLQKRLKKTIDR